MKWEHDRDMDKWYISLTECLRSIESAKKYLDKEAFREIIFVVPF
jgi:hypothetical protein